MKKTLNFLIFLLMTGAISADEGMWLLTDPPVDQLKQKYNFVLSKEWLQRAQKSSVRFNSGGSGSFVSSEGLIITNHHVGGDCLDKLSPAGKDYYRDGYFARSRSEELKCPDLELNVLTSIDDVTELVNSAVTPQMSTQAASEARQKKMSEIEKESADKTGLRSDIVTLYHGGLYHLYSYKKFTDVRVVFSPEAEVASFGGDIDNFEFPRFDFDIAFFRAYENGQPVRPEYFLKWNASGAAENDLVFVIGNPSSTNRLDTIAGLKFRRDVFLPYTLNKQQYREALFRQFANLGKEERQLAGERLYDAGNSLKSAGGQYRGLLDASIMKIKEKNETKLLSEVNTNPELKAEFASAWEQIDNSVTARKQFWHEYMLLEKGDAFDSTLFEIARYLTRMALEMQRPGPERLREYRDSNLDSLKQKLYSPAPISPKLEQAQLTGSLIFLAQNLGGSHPLVLEILDGRSPEARAAELVSGTKLIDPEYRKKIAGAGWKAIETSDDRLIQLALKIDPYARKLRKRYESEVEEVERQAYAKIEIARFRTTGKSQYPDGTFTLRFAYGLVKGYSEADQEIPLATTLGGAFLRSDEHENREPFSLPESWRKNKQNLNLEASLNFVSTADTYSGNSGSPVMNRAGEFVGINFDRNRHGLTRNFIYVEEKARQISVHPAAIAEMLRNGYNAKSLLIELGVEKGGQKASTK